MGFLGLLLWKGIWETMGGWSDGRNQEAAIWWFGHLRWELRWEQAPWALQWTADLRHWATGLTLPPDLPLSEWWDWRRTISSGKHWRTEALLDRLALTWEPQAGWRIRVGKQMITFRRGFVYSLLDFFPILPPQELFVLEPRGADAVWITREKGAQQWHLVWGKPTKQEETLFLAWRTIWGNTETTFFLGKTREDDFAALSADGHAGDFGWRAEAMTGEAGSGYLFSIDRRFGDRWLLELEYFRNPWGGDRFTDYRWTDFLRGLIPGVGRKYLALSGRHQWNPLDATEATWAYNLADDSTMLRLEWVRVASDTSELRVGVVFFRGDRFSEFGGWDDFYSVRLTSFAMGGGEQW